ncbi:MAG: type II toxin-antitoxin system VapC family toxin [Nostoc sp. EfeVER01]|uniref:type II toxin-antitoxin system VapC family toxin n=1 Tax=unclassified Nostoc TaxID=2593658 RepID=UPI002AD362D2|nr:MULTISPECIES: type II toxin-antitoxin system VapC family toxin [unclassified Nostoc]MDZ7946727.1 type II toxin-antitoxin system VapC family toxin [Nostoc sp. EfeVER01]MDZ7992723.1 type II toxin-antitoxin system VapC family toxin [Nostoc sp. EspVER01]
MYLLDTNHCSRIIFGETNVIRRLQEHIGLGVATSVIVQGELLYMVQKSSQQQANLRFVKTFLQTIDLYPISGEVADVYGSLKGEIVEHFGPKDKAKRRKFTVQDLGFSDNDLWIASTALHYNLTVISADSDFQRI